MLIIAFQRSYCGVWSRFVLLLSNAAKIEVPRKSWRSDIPAQSPPPPIEGLYCVQIKRGTSATVPYPRRLISLSLRLGNSVVGVYSLIGIVRLSAGSPFSNSKCIGWQSHYNGDRVLQRFLKRILAWTSCLIFQVRYVRAHLFIHWILNETVLRDCARAGDEINRN